MQKFLIYGDLTKRRMTDEDGTPMTLPPLVQGDLVTFALRLLDRAETGTPQLVQRNVRSLRASIGMVAAPPTSGHFKLRIGANGTPSILIDFNADRYSLKSALTGLPEAAAYGGIEHAFGTSSGCWMLRFGADIEVPLQAADNLLSPISFIRVRAFRQNGRWWHELKLLQSPVAYSGTSERVLAEPPSVRRIREGQTYSEAGVDYIINEVQAVKVPAGFTGTYYLKFDGRATSLLSEQDDPTAIQTALNALFSDGKQRFTVTNPEPYNAYVEFVGPLKGAAQDLIVAEVGSVTPGDLTFSLDLNTAEVFAALRDTAQYAAQFEVELEIAEDNDPPEAPGKIVTLFHENVTLVRELQWEEMAAAAGIDWLQPPQPKDYIPFTRDQIITGSQYYVGVFGDGSVKKFVIAHNLGTDAVLPPAIRQNASGGRILVPGIDYTMVVTDENSLTVATLAADPPSLNSLAIVIATAGPKSAFQAHTHTVAQIVGLQAVIDSLSNRVASLETLVPNLGPAQTSISSSGAFVIPIQELAEVLFLPVSAGNVFGQSGIDATKLPKRPPYMLPAVHDTTVTPLPLPLPAPAAGNVWKNQTGNAVFVYGGGGIRGSSVDPGGFIASDGRILYPAREAGSTVSYFPTPFERILWNLYINEKMLTVGKTLTVEFGLGVQLVNATSQAQWVLVIEKGDAPSETVGNPNAAEINLLDVIWDTEHPILKQRLILTPPSDDVLCRLQRLPKPAGNAHL